MRKHRTALTIKQQLIIGISSIFVVILVSLVAIVGVAAKSYWDARSEVTKLAKTYAKVSDVTNFSIYNGKETYYSLFGKTKDGSKVAVLVSEKTGAIEVYPQSRGISKSVAKAAAKAYGAKSISSVRLGKYEDTPVWEVRSGTTYYLVGFVSGQVIKVEG